MVMDQPASALGGVCRRYEWIIRAELIQCSRYAL